ncbi:hypothetical protein S40293_00447 [Stachybotrys chartarum IBT 40293]|nr:hypothetical protein S40293_00447 [Stachybotrys chartarum IBT 40293]
MPPRTAFPFSALPIPRSIIRTPRATALFFPSPRRPSSSSSSTTTAPPAYMEPRPSSSVILVSATNEVLLLHRVHTSTSFASAHVFPGGNLDARHDGDVPAAGSPARHADGEAYRRAAVRETFEETGILLAKGPGGALLDLSLEERDVARRRVHAGEVGFGEWLAQVGGVADTDGLIPFTRWLTPATVPKRFTTQMYLYLLPIARTGIPSSLLIPTPDGGVEHTAALFAAPQTFLAQAAAGAITLFPPQVYLLTLLARFFAGAGDASLEEAPLHYTAQRRRLRAFLRTVPTAETDRGRQHATAHIPWADKLISPHTLFIRESDKRIVLGLDKAGPELKGQARGGDWENVALVRFTKAGPSEVEIRRREDVLEEERRFKAGSKL